MRKQTIEVDSIIEEKFLKELPVFETFFHKVGFKRIEGAIYGLLVLSRRPLTSEEIEKTLKLSQSAVSNALKVLSHYGAILTQDGLPGKDRRLKYHFAKEDSLGVVSSVFKKREQENILEFKQMAKLIRSQISHDNDERSKRLDSIINTCEIAESVIGFVLELTSNRLPSEYPGIIKQLPRTFNILTSGLAPVANITNNLKSNLASKLKDGLIKFTGENAK